MPLVKLSTKNKGERNKIINALFKNDIQVGLLGPCTIKNPTEIFKIIMLKA